MRWPVDEMGRNSVRPSTMPRMNASIKFDKKLPDGAPEGGRVVRAIVPCTFQRHPPLSPAPRLEKALRVDYRNHLVALGDEAEQRCGERRRMRQRIEPMPEHPAHRQVGIVM